MKIEDILKQLNEKGMPAVVILKANEGYSAIPMSKYIYKTSFLLLKHYNDKTIEDALKQLLNEED